MIEFSPKSLERPSDFMIHTGSFQSLGVHMVGVNLPGASNNWIAVNQATFVPFYVPEPVVITKLGWGNGSAVAGNLDAGIYDEAGNRLVSTGSTAQAGTNAVQAVDVADTLLGRGRYYLAMASNTSGATQKVYSNIAIAQICAAFGLLQQLTAFPLPNPATFARRTTANIPWIIAQGFRTFGP